MDFSKIPFDLVINILNIVVLFLIVRLLAYKPIRKFLDARRQKLDDEKAANEKIKAEAEEKKAEYEALLRNSEDAANEKKNEILVDAQNRADEIIASARDTAKNIVAEAEKAAKEQKADALRSSAEGIAQVAVGVAERILSRNVTDADTKALVDEFIKDISEE